MKPRLEHANSGPLSLWERVRVRAACTWKALTPCSSPKGRGEPHGMKPRRRRRADRAGYALVLFIMMFFGLMGLAALVIDMGFARLAQRQMQTAVDSAALEGLRWRDAQLQDFPQGWQQDADFQTQVMSLWHVQSRYCPSLGCKQRGCQPVHRLRGPEYRGNGVLRRRAGRDVQRWDRSPSGHGCVPGDAAGSSAGLPANACGRDYRRARVKYRQRPGGRHGGGDLQPKLSLRPTKPCALGRRGR